MCVCECDAVMVMYVCVSALSVQEGEGGDNRRPQADEHDVVLHKEMRQSHEQFC